MLTDKINTLKTMLFTNEIAWSRQSGVPFILTFINEEEQLYLSPRLDELKADGKSAGFAVKIVNVEQLIFTLLEGHDDLEELYEYEKEDLKEFKEEMQSTIPKYVRAWIIDEAKKLGEKGRMVFTRTGSLAPHANLVSLLAKLENEVTIPLCFFVPGIKNGTKHYLLNSTHDISAARAYVV